MPSMALGDSYLHDTPILYASLSQAELPNKLTTPLALRNHYPALR